MGNLARSFQKNTFFPYRKKIAVFGDSITYVYHDRSNWTANYVNYGANGYFNWANALLGAPFELVIGGFGGITAAVAYSTYLNADVLSQDVDYCFVQMGANDVDGSNTYAGTVADLKKIYDAIEAAGIQLITSTIMPQYSTGTTALSAANALILVNVNEWIKNYSLDRGYLCVDFYGVLVDPDSTAAEPISGILSDTKHPTTTAAIRMGRLVHDTLKNVIPRYPALYRGNTRPAAEVLPNPALRGSGGTAGTGATGDVAAGWAVARVSGDNTVTCTSDVAADATDLIPSTWQVMTFDGVGVAASKFSLNDAVYIGGKTFAEGDIVEASCEVEINIGAGGKGVELLAQFDGDSETMKMHCLKAAQDVTDAFSNMRLTLKTPPITLPAMTTTASSTMIIYMYVAAGETGTIKVRNASFKKVDV